MSKPETGSSDPALRNLQKMLPDLEASDKDVHSHPELSMQEKRTSGLAADRLRAAGYEVTTGVGKTGVVGLLRNGKGPTVLLRADMDGLFAVIGAQKAIDHGIHPLMAAIMGMVTGIGGGMTRDVLAGDVPFVLKGDLYAIAALGAGAIVAIGHVAEFSPLYPMVLGATVCVLLRLMAIYRRWGAPVAQLGKVREHD